MTMLSETSAIDYRNPENRVRPAQASRRQCLICMNGSSKAIDECPSDETCLLYPYRYGKGRVTLKLIRTYCLHCSGWPLKDGKLDPAYKDGGQGEAWHESKNCTGYDCPFWPYRPGTVPYKNAGYGLSEGAKRGQFKRSRLPQTASISAER